MSRLGARLALTYVSLILMAGLAISLFLYVGVREVYIGLVTDSLARSARTAAVEANAAQSSAVLDELAAQVALLTGARVTLISRSGMVLADTEVNPMTLGNHAGRPEVRTALAGGVGVETRTSATTGQETLYVAVPAGRDLIARLAVPLAALQSAVARLRQTTVAPTVIACALGAIVAYRTARRITRPLYEMSQIAEEMAEGRLSVRASLEGPDETAALGRTLNRMAESLESHIAQLGAAKESLEALLENLPAGVVEIGRGYSIVSANPAAERLLGFQREAVRGRHYAVLLSSPTLSEAVVAALEEGRLGSLEVEVGDDGDDLVHVSISPRRTAEGRMAGAILVLQDLGQVRRDARLRRELVANVSHELRTPVAAIRAISETLLGGAIRDPQAAERFLDHIGRESERLARLVDDLLELARLEGRGSELDRLALDLQPVVERAVERLRPLACRKGQSLTLEQPAGVRFPIIGDEHYLERAVANLLDNAVKFTPDGGRIEVRIGRLSAEADAPARDEVLLEVSDNGLGLAPEAAGRVFERFYRAAGDRSRQSGGTGLGLAIVKHVVQMHGGRIGVSSPGLGLGCRFWFTVPITPA
jgi:two-component system phosphate regulon sensor histidine kinase PhoR